MTPKRFILRRVLTLILTLACAFSCTGVANAQTNETRNVPDLEEVRMSDYRGRVRAPELLNGRGWLNTDRPLTLQNLRGKIVLLDFWTYGCINCIHIIPDLKKLEAKYANNLVVIGVHSAKFDNEKQTDNIRRIIERYEIEHPVVNDADFKIWDSYAVNAFPTLMLIDPAGYVVGKATGEGNYETLDKQIGQLVTQFRERGALDEQPLSLALERAKSAAMPLAFPGKVFADERSDRLFIADSNHNRIVVTRLDGTLINTIGTGAKGRGDGAFESASFYRPQGFALDAKRNVLYVADTENHLIRALDFNTKTVTTIAGMGAQLRRSFVSGAARETALNSPWDLLLAEDKLYVAMAGSHQIWEVDVNTKQARVFAGSLAWREARADGARLDAAFAQPSGLATDNKKLYVADSESNIVRAIDLKDSAEGEGQVRTLAGGDLFDFGDRDGAGDDVRLQHPLGVVFANDKLFIADTYNHKIKQLDLQTNVVKTFAGNGKAGQTDGAQPTFYEPGGLSVARGKLYVADTNNHAIRVVDLQTKQAMTLQIKNLRAPDAAIIANANDAVSGASEIMAANKNEILLPLQRLESSLQNDKTNAEIVVNVRLPEGYHLNNLAPHRYTVAVTRGAEHVALENTKTSLVQSNKDLRLPLRIPLRVASTGAAELRVASTGAAELRVTLTLYYCREDNTGVCRVKTLAWRVPVEAVSQSKDATQKTEVKIDGEIKLD